MDARSLTSVRSHCDNPRITRCSLCELCHNIPLVTAVGDAGKVMPDWFYRTVSRSVLFRLSTETSRDLVLGFLGTLARLPVGPHLIDFLGHMRPDPCLGRTVLGVRFPSPVGLGVGIDGRLMG